MEKVKYAVIGGSGFYKFLKGEEVEVDTPYGKPSDKILIASHEGKKFAFLPRHAKGHKIPPHKINYQANLAALKELGVERVIAPSAVGSLKPEMKPGHFVINDQFIDRTKGNRKDTFYNGPRVAHISTAEPYCPELRKLAIESCDELGVDFHERGAAVVIEGPRFSTKAESKLYSSFGDIINMTQYPEVALARELKMCYLNISLVTDYDAGLEDYPEIEPVSATEIAKVLIQNTNNVKQVILKIIERLAKKPECKCNQALKNALL